MIKGSTRDALGNFGIRSNTTNVAVEPLPPKLDYLVNKFKDSNQAKITEAELNRLHQGLGLNGLQQVTPETTPFRTYDRATWWTQFVVLSSRAFKNLYRWVGASIRVTIRVYVPC